MAASTTPRSAERSLSTPNAPAPTGPGDGLNPRLLAVAVSGGRDSMALLHCTLRAAKTLGLEVIALHVHHGLQPAADAWARQVERTCKRWADRGWPLRFAMQRLAGQPAPGDSIEAWARRGRYAALGALARQAGAALVMLAHHRRDQAETFLLQALRGGGPAGLAAMPRSIEREGLTWARPWLRMSSQAIGAYARRHRLRFVDDPSNADPRYARSRLRTQVMPVLCQAFAEAESLLVEAAARSAEAQAVLAEVAQDDLAALIDGEALRIDAWLQLSPARRRNALQAWLGRHLKRGVPQSLVERLMHELPGSGPARWPGEGVCLRRYRGRLEAHAAVLPQPEVPALTTMPAGIQGAGLYPVAGQGGALRVEPVAAGGVALSCLHQAQWRPRTGGERYQRAPGTPARSLKKQFQAAAVPAWQREAPLLFDAQGQLLFVPGLGIDARRWAAPGEPQAGLSWIRSP